MTQLEKSLHLTYQLCLLKEKLIYFQSPIKYMGYSQERYLSTKEKIFKCKISNKHKYKK